jgi:hypothetical protein
MAKCYQCLKGKPVNMYLGEFAFIFTYSMVLTTIIIFWVYPFLNFLVCGGIGLVIIPYSAAYLYE